MSIATEIQRLQTAKADLKTAIEGKGVTVSASATLDAYADLVDAIETGGGGSGPRWELIGSVELELSEYTDTSTVEETNTGINVATTDYAYIMSIITCDAAITTSTEWGMTISLGGRYTSNGNYCSIANGGQKGASTLSKSAMVSATNGWGSYGVWIPNNSSNIIVCRKAHASGCPLIRGGTYTVAVYGLASL